MVVIMLEGASMATDNTPVTRILRLPEVLARVGLSRSAVYEHMATGDFPASVRLTPGSVGWHSNDIDEWIASRPRTA